MSCGVAGEVFKSLRQVSFIGKPLESKVLLGIEREEWVVWRGRREDWPVGYTYAWTVN